MAAIPYAEFVDETISGLIGPGRRRDAGWIVEWASLKAYPIEPSASNGKSSAGIGTHAEQPSRKLDHMHYRFTSANAVPDSAVGRGSHPLHGSFDRHEYG